MSAKDNDYRPCLQAICDTDSEGISEGESEDEDAEDDAEGAPRSVTAWTTDLTAWRSPDGFPEWRSSDFFSTSKKVLGSYSILGSIRRCYSIQESQLRGSMHMHMHVSPIACKYLVKYICKEGALWNRIEDHWTHSKL